MDDLNVTVAGIRALLFASALCAAIIYSQQLSESFDLLCAIFRGRVKGRHIVGLGSLGWFIAAISSMIMTSHRCYKLLFLDVGTNNIKYGNDMYYTVIGLSGLALGFYLPVFAMLWYRNKLGYALAVSLFCPSVGLGFALLAQHVANVTH